MNKIIILILFLFLFSSSAYSVKLPKADAANNKTLIVKIEELDKKLEEVKNKKEKIAVYEEFAEAFFINNEYDTAADIYAILLDSKPSKKKRAEYYVRLGDIEAAKGAYNISLECYKNALALYKNNNAIKRKIGDILLESNLYVLAEQNFKEILASDKKSDYAKRKLGDIYFSQSRYSRALEYYKSIDGSYYDKNIIANMSVCYKSMNKIDEAIRLVDDFLKSFPSSEMYFLSGQLYSNAGEFNQAEKQFLWAIRLDDTNFSAYVYLASIYIENDEIDKAEEMLQKANSINSYTSIVDIMLAKIASKKERLYEARRYSSNAVLKAKTPFLKYHAQRMLDFFNEKK